MASTSTSPPSPPLPWGKVVEVEERAPGAEDDDEWQPRSANAHLEGITRTTIIELLREELGVPVIERPIDRTEIYLCDEFFMTGTAAQVTAVTKVDHRPIGAGVMGPITTQLRKIFDDTIRGRLPKYRHWNVPVYEQIPLRSHPSRLSQKVSQT